MPCITFRASATLLSQPLPQKSACLSYSACFNISPPLLLYRPIFCQSPAVQPSAHCTASLFPARDAEPPRIDSPQPLKPPTDLAAFPETRRSEASLVFTRQPASHPFTSILSPPFIPSTSGSRHSALQPLHQQVSAFPSVALCSLWLWPPKRRCRKQTNTRRPFASCPRPKPPSICTSRDLSLAIESVIDIVPRSASRSIPYLPPP
ncbi:uncharacterized protein K460DRAFT_49718 [Cucurbitaria berberidis CBS 394.84]|uniref:Uncharacterized protein n=1 Tax=Cucurbitaria berberidis CBS 394.84 TaxID=1168544 RepID=A0A9P4GIP1_9PLEO|nr:uncharacterized protein K460DRAFT_49718 [Cucurbitaria berberidis CBS 394.84]KAF1846898.1 hypothetical protein K460DRAFT_49718 [Cucurbitaria berberidis CBS 394.84]